MAFTSINGEDRLVQATFATHLQKVLGWESIYAFNDETFGPDGTLGRTDTLYIDKPMKAHTLMQAIARANRVYPGKDFGLIVDYNGMLKSLRAALWIRDQGSGIRDQGSGIRDQGLLPSSEWSG